jgi:hypothetical protein
MTRKDARLPLILALLGTLLALLPAAAQAQAPTGRMTITLSGVQGLGRTVTAPQGRFMRATGVVTPYVPGQVVTVRAVTSRRTVSLQHLAIRQVGNHGEWEASFRASRIGTLLVKAGHAATPELGRIDAVSRAVNVFLPVAGIGARGTRVLFLQNRLYALGYSTPRGGYYDFATAQAVLAFRKVNGLGRRYTANRIVYGFLANGRGGFVPRFPRQAKHVEADLTRQVLALVSRGGRVYRVLTLSSGKASTPTVLGTFHVYSKDFGTNSHGMVDSNYFVGGYAIHGYADVPTFPASHGCLRIPIPLAGFVFRWIDYGDPVDVYYRTRVVRPRVINRHPGP